MRGCWLVMILLAQLTTRAPSTQHAMSLDLTTPQAAAKSLFKAVAAGDRDAVRSTLYADDDAALFLGKVQRYLEDPALLFIESV